MSAEIDVTREQVLAYRVQAQGLDRTGKDARNLAVWDLGLQDSPGGSAPLSLAARLAGGAGAVPDLTKARSWVTAWATRGAPVVLRTGDAKAFAAALWPVDEADAIARLAGNGQQLKKAKLDPIEALRVTAEAFRTVVEAEMTKGETSSELTKVLPDGYITWCGSCKTHHIGDQLMRLAALPGGARLVPGADVATLTPIARWSGVPGEAKGTEALIAAYLHLSGPATQTDVGAFLGTTARAIKAVWPEDLVEVSVDGKRAWLAGADVEALTGAPEPEGVRLLARSDPWLLARDRAVIVAAKAHQKAVWPVLGAPGVVLVDGEVAGTWRTKATTKRLTLTVKPFAKLSKTRRDAVTEEPRVSL